MNWKHIKIPVPVLPNMPTWLKTQQSLLLENASLKDQLSKAKELIDSMNKAINYNVLHANQLLENIRQEEVTLLGGIALQHQGEFLIKDEFISMLTSPEYHLKVLIEHSDKDQGVFIRTVEIPQNEEKAENAEDKE